MTRLMKKVDAYAAGDLKHAADAMSLLWEVSKREKCPVSTPTPHRMAHLKDSNKILGCEGEKHGWVLYVETEAGTVPNLVHAQAGSTQSIVRGLPGCGIFIILCGLPLL